MQLKSIPTKENKIGFSILCLSIEARQKTKGSILGSDNNSIYKLEQKNRLALK